MFIACELLAGGTNPSQGWNSSIVRRERRAGCNARFGVGQVHPLVFHFTLRHQRDRYYALSAACALFKHAESRLNNFFSAGSLRIHYASVEGTMPIDPELVKNDMRKTSSSGNALYRMIFY
jgi:hypothetical protein